MADTTPRARQPQRQRLIKERPLSQEDAKLKGLARELIDDDLRASSTRRSLSELMARLWRLLSRNGGGNAGPAGGAAGGGGGGGGAGRAEPSQGDYGHPFTAANGAPPAGSPESSASSASPAQQKTSELTREEVEKLTHYMLEQITESPRLQRAYANNRLPMLETLLTRSAPENQPTARERWTREAVVPPPPAEDGRDRRAPSPVLPSPEHPLTEASRATSFSVPRPAPPGQDALRSARDFTRQNSPTPPHTTTRQGLDGSGDSQSESPPVSPMTPSARPVPLARPESPPVSPMTPRARPVPQARPASPAPRRR